MFYPTLKVVSSNCNLRCVYCYYKGIHRKKPIRMNDITLKSIIQKLLALSGEEKEVHFYWHGGEPLLAGIDFYQKIILLENELNVYGKKICNHIQTNATLLTDNWVDFLVGNDFNVGISLDGPKEIQDVNRPTISGGGSFDSVMKGLKLFQEREKFPSIISVVTNESLGNANKIFDFFVENKIKRFLPKYCCFFFQAEDGIRFWSVTGVQTCALPISPSTSKSLPSLCKASMVSYLAVIN